MSEEWGESEPVKELRFRIKWIPVGVVFEDGPIDVQGVNPWLYAWQDLHTRIELYHPTYPNQRHMMDIYRIDAPSGQILFATGELSNGVYGFFVPTRKRRWLECLKILAGIAVLAICVWRMTL
jgi:hypothetical protein